MTMGFGKSALIALLIIAALAQSARATTYTVGGSTGWVLGITPTFYNDWAKAITFYEGDILDFVYVGSTHNVLEVTAADLASCNINSPLQVYNSVGGAKITLKTTGNHYYICGIVGHCAGYMKMELVVSAASPASAPAPSPRLPLTPAPSVNGTAGPSVSISSTTSTDSSGSSVHRSGLALIIGVIVCAFACLLLQ